MEAPEEMKAPPEASKLPLRAYQLNLPFSWAPPDARNALFAWTRDVSIAITAADTEPFVEFFCDCRGDVLDCLEPNMTNDDTLHIAEFWSSCPEVCAWVREIEAAAVAEHAVVRSINQQP